jgi:hypothetical protein
MEQTCKQCGVAFEIDEQDAAFYKRIDVPVPTLCPSDREQRRWAWRSKNFYFRNCEMCGKKVMAWVSPENKQIKCYCEYCFRSDDFDAMEYGRDFSFDRSFFEQIAELLNEVPRHISNAVNNENSEYIISAHNNKNCYFIDEIDGCKDCYFGYTVQYCRDILEGLYVRDSEIGYELIKAEDCYSVFYSQNVFNCRNSAFLLNCRNCTNCLFCCNLRNGEYCIFNESVSPEEFRKRWSEIFVGQSEVINGAREEFNDFLKRQIFPSSSMVNCEDCSGDYLSNCKNAKDSFCIDNCRDCRYCSDIHHSKDCYDVNIYEGDLMYESLHVGPKGYGQFFSILGWFSKNLYYCVDVRSCRDCFGCVGLKQKQYCIFNKQYSQEEYSELKEKIIEHMKKGLEWGEFFPMEMSPLPYNTTMAQRFYPLTESEAVSRGLRWEDEDSKKEFKITDAEKKFYDKYGIPLPTIHPVARLENLWNRMPKRKLSMRKCNKCDDETEGTLPVDFPGKVYCQSCYVDTVNLA